MSSVDVLGLRVFELGEGATAWPTAALGLTALAVQASSTAAALSGLWPVEASVLVNTACAYAQFTVAHDAAHRSVSRVFWLNEISGYAAAFVLCGPYAAIRRNHLHHHAHTNDPREDPDFRVATTPPRSSGRSSFCGPTTSTTCSSATAIRCSATRRPPLSPS